MGRRRFVDGVVIRRRMDGKDLRFEAAARATARRRPPACGSWCGFCGRCPPRDRPVIDVVIVPVLEQPAGPVVDVALEPTRASAERQRLTQGDGADVRRALTYRPHVAHRREDFDRCAMSKYGTHRFVANVFTCCEFCGRHYQDCLLPKEPR